MSSNAQQTYPVQVSASINFPSAFLTDYTDPSNVNIRVYLSDLTKTNYKVTLKIYLSSDKVNLISNQGINLTLQGGQVYFLNDQDLKNLFTPANMVDAATKLPYTSDILPEGIYHLSFEARDANVPSVVVSNATSDFTVFSINRYDPPMLTYPANKQIFDLQTINQNVFFTWMPRNISYSPKQQIKYHFRIVKVVPVDRNPYNALNTTPANTANSIVDVSDLDFPVFVYTPAEVPLQEGNVYAWQVTAYEVFPGATPETSSARFKNAGQSEVFTFSIKENCQPVTPFQTPVIGNNQVDLGWTKDPSHVAYELDYRPFGTSLPWTPVTTAENTTTLDNTVLQPGVTYEYTVRAQCNNWIDPSYGGTFSLTAPTCQAPEPIIANTSDAGIKLSWDAISGATAYRFQYKNLANGETTYTIADLGASDLSYTLDPISSGSYEIKVDAICQSEEAPGKVYEVNYNENGVVGPCPIPVPFQLIAQRQYGDTASISWNTNDNHTPSIYTGYKLTWWHRDSVDVKRSQSSETLHVTGTPIFDDQLYVYQLEFQCGTKSSLTPQGMFRIEGTNSIVSKDPGTADCFPPSLLQGEARSTTSALLDWAKVDGAEDYQLFYAPKGEKVFKPFTTTSKSALIKDLEDSRLYQFVVRCRCSGKYSIFSDTALVDLAKGKTNANCDSSMFVVSDKQSTTNIRLCWKYDTLHTGYKITYREASQSPSEDYTIAYTNLDTLTNLHAGDTLKYTVQNLNAGTSYIFQLEALCGTDEAMKNFPLTVSTQPDTKSQGSCGGAALCDKSSTTPLTSLNQGDKIHCADYEIEVTEVDPTSSPDGIYSGKGTMPMPIAGLGDFVTVNVSFENVKINAVPNACVYDGTITIDSVNGSVLTQDMRDKVKQMQSDVTDILSQANNTLKDIQTGVDQAQDAVQNAIDYFQGGDDVGSVKDGGLGEPTASGSIPTGTKSATVNGNTVTIAGNDVTVSSFPALIKDADGNIFQVTATGTVTHVGKYDPTLAADPILDMTNGSVIFKANSSAKYDFDAYQDKFKVSIQISREYEVINSNYHVPAKLLLPGETDLVDAVLTSPTYDPSNVVFANGKGAVFNYTRSGNTFSITIPGGPDADGQNIYAWYIDGTDKKAIGKLLVPSYAPKQKMVVVIPVGKSVVSASRFEEGLNKAYAKLGITYTVTLDETFKDNTDWDLDGDGKVLVAGSNLISNDYQGEEKSMVENYITFKGGAENIDPATGYFFAVYEAPASDSGLVGKMPATEQFGFLYTGAAPVELMERTIAHEIGHGDYHLEHTYNSIYLGKDSRGTTTNLMDYTYDIPAYDLWKFQWDIVHDPGTVWGILKRDREAEAVYTGNVKSLLEAIRENRIAGSNMTLLKDAINKESLWEAKDIVLNNYKYSKIKIQFSNFENNYTFNPSLYSLFTEVESNLLFDNQWYGISYITDGNTMIKIYTTSYLDRSRLCMYLYGECDFMEKLNQIHNSTLQNKNVTLSYMNNCSYISILENQLIDEILYDQIFCSFANVVSKNSDVTFNPKDYRETNFGFELLKDGNVVFTINYYPGDKPIDVYRKNKRRLKVWLFGQENILVMNMHEDGRIIQFVPKNIQTDFQNQFSDESYAGRSFQVRYVYHPNNGIDVDLGTYSYYMAVNQYPNQPLYGTTALIDLIDIRQVEQNGFGIRFNSASERYYMNLKTFGSLLCSMRNAGYNDITFNGFSDYRGVSIGGSISHKNGFNGDLMYLRMDQTGDGCLLSGNYWQEMDESRQNNLNDLLFNYRWLSMLSQYYNKNKLLNHTINDVNKGHYDHLHIQGYSQELFETDYEE